MTREQEFRRRWYEAHRDRFLADEQYYQQAKAKSDRFPASASEALGLLADLARTGDLESFKKRTQAWAVKPTTLGFKGTIGQMMLNIFVNRADEPERVARLLAESLRVPASDDEARAKLDELADYSRSIKKGSTPAIVNVPFVASYFWGLADHDRWPVIWPSAVDFVQFLTGETLPSDPPERYQEFLNRVREVASDNQEFEMTANWWNTEWPVFLDELLLDRAVFGHKTDGSAEERIVNARALLSVARNLGESLVEEVSEALGHALTYTTPSVEWKPGRARGDVWVDWYSKQQPGMGMRVWINNRGAAAALRPGSIRKGWRNEVARIFESADYPDCRVLGGASSMIGDDVGLGGANWAEFVYGRWFERDQLAEIDLAATVVEVATLLKPLFNELLSLALGRDGKAPRPDDPLLSFVLEFNAKGNYPTQEDLYDLEKRRNFSEMLSPDAQFDIVDLRRIWNTGDYGGPGPMPELNRTFKNASDDEYKRIIGAMRYLCWGEEPVAERINRMLNDDELRIRGLGESVIMKLLAITHPETFIPVFPYGGDSGKARMLQLLELGEPSGTTPGEIQVASNQLLLERLRGFFQDDTFRMKRFLYWYLEHPANGPSNGPEDDPLDALVDELLIDRGFFENIVGLLGTKNKNQVIFYGPPGTGKTFLARKLAEALVPDADRRAIVQFHPSSSYEDFFEGYRPEEDENGSLTYRLKPGPLARMADKARANPDQIHIMIIDEINRANLPKVLGELLYLFEYRDEPVQTLYSPDDGFVLPHNLWFIGTMNTADRSIALVDAALRRRFHFVPFFPNRPPIEDLLEHWLEAKGEPAWVAGLVAYVNDELRDELGGSHLLLGPSYFMQENLDEQAVRRIWEYNVEPFIEDQFFGNQEQIDKFRFNEVLKRYRRDSGIEETAVPAVEEQEVEELDSPSEIPPI